MSTSTTTGTTQGIASAPDRFLVLLFKRICVNPTQMNNLVRVCRRWRDVAKENRNDLWRWFFACTFKLCESRLPPIVALPTGGAKPVMDWHLAYVHRFKLRKDHLSFYGNEPVPIENCFNFAQCPCYKEKLRWESSTSRKCLVCNKILPEVSPHDAQERDDGTGSSPFFVNPALRPSVFIDQTTNASPCAITPLSEHQFYPQH
ncbi:hypothetical protein Pelo_3360 [Pelomyxa schiedti]|nr:hypothetical protein Pelo_3360 [Pelomyxa schiedti]